MRKNNIHIEGEVIDSWKNVHLDNIINSKGVIMSNVGRSNHRKCLKYLSKYNCPL